jgi:hypothetical protein
MLSDVYLLSNTCTMYYVLCTVHKYPQIPTHTHTYPQIPTQGCIWSRPRLPSEIRLAGGKPQTDSARQLLLREISECEAVSDEAAADVSTCGTGKLKPVLFYLIFFELNYIIWYYNIL